MKKILVATDGAPESDKALEWAANAARGNGAEVMVVYAVEDFCPVALDEVDCNTIRSLMDKESRNVVEAAVKKLSSWGIAAQGRIARGEPVEAIVALAKEEKADEIIAYSHGRKGLAKILKGSVTARLAEEAPCPVTLIK